MITPQRSQILPFKYFCCLYFPQWQGQSEDPFAVKTVLFGLLSAVVDRLGARYLAVGPFPDPVGRSERYLYRVKYIGFG